jgi:hypothetical protein
LLTREAVAIETSTHFATSSASLYSSHYLGATYCAEQRTHAIEAVPAERSAQPEIVVRHLNNRVNSTPLVNPLHTLYAVYAYTGLTSSVGSSARAQTCHASRTEDRVAVNILSNHRRQDCLHEVVASTASCNCKAGDKNVRGAQGSYTANSASPMSASSCGTAYRSTGSKVVFDQVLL